MDKEIDKLVDLLGCSIEEAKDILIADKKIDKGEKMDFDLSKEQEKQAKKFANATTHKKPVAYKFDKKEKKADVTKEGSLPGCTGNCIKADLSVFLNALKSTISP